MKATELKKLNLPDKPGVYFFRKGGEILYIGKATSLRDRTRSYFASDLISTRGPSIVDMVFKADKVTWEETDSVLEALILEAELIKGHLPYYNVKEKDDKSFACVVITKEDFPKVLVVRKRELESTSPRQGLGEKIQAVYGPFPSTPQLREALKIIRRIFPFIDESSSKKDNYQFYKQLGLTPDLSRPLTKGEMSLATEGVLVAQLAYKNNIENLKLFFQGKKKKILMNLKKEMMEVAKEKRFEQAQEIKNRIFALTHINDVSLLKKDYITVSKNTFRIEAYDIAHMGGKNMVGVMTVVEDRQVAKAEYKKFIIRTQSGSNDTGALEEVLSRRLRHTEWGIPSLIVMDGSTAQENVAKRVLSKYQLKIPIVSVVKDNHHKAKAIHGDAKIIKEYKDQILLANSEAHRFAITFHKQKRNKSFLI